MIHLDANILIAAADNILPVQKQLRGWLLRGETFATSAVAWAEFLNGPLSPENKEDGRVLVQNRIIHFRMEEAELAAQLFNHAKRRRGSMPDCMIAAAAISAKASLATFNQKDFSAFVPLGLRLA